VAQTAVVLELIRWRRGSCLVISHNMNDVFQSPTASPCSARPSRRVYPTASSTQIVVDLMTTEHRAASADRCVASGLGAGMTHLKTRTQTHPICSVRTAHSDADFRRAGASIAASTASEKRPSPLRIRDHDISARYASILLTRIAAAKAESFQ